MTPERINDLGEQAEHICSALCTRPDLLAAINQELSAVLHQIEHHDDYDFDSCWSEDQHKLFTIWIEATANMTSEIVNGNKRQSLYLSRAKVD